MRRKLTKTERIHVHNKCNGHCAYCGCVLEYKDMQVDHAIPLKLGGADELENMLPACRSCNHYKATLDVEGFRKYIAGAAHRLMRDNVAFRAAVRFGTVKHMGDNVTFYFETTQVDQYITAIVNTAAGLVRNGGEAKCTKRGDILVPTRSTQ